MIAFATTRTFLWLSSFRSVKSLKRYEMLTYLVADGSLFSFAKRRNTFQNALTRFETLLKKHSKFKRSLTAELGEVRDTHVLYTLWWRSREPMPRPLGCVFLSRRYGLSSS